MAAAMRSDARRNREAILEAARDLFVDSADFPMIAVARRAGVGQGTLYRHFPDRSHLATAVMADDVDHLEQIARQKAGDPDAFFVLLQAMVEVVARSNAMPELARRDSSVDSGLEQARQRVRDFMAGPLREAKAAGAVRADLTLEDVFLVVWMILGAGRLVADPVARAATASRAFTLALSGVAPLRPESSGRRERTRRGR